MGTLRTYLDYPPKWERESKRGIPPQKNRIQYLPRRAEIGLKSIQIQPYLNSGFEFVNFQAFDSFNGYMYVRTQVKWRFYWFLKH